MYRISKKAGIETCEISACHFEKMHTKKDWLIAMIIDCYLEFLVLQDIKRYPVKKNIKYVPTSFFKQIQSDDPQNMYYSEKMHRLFMEQKMMDCDGIIFGGTDNELHFFMVLLFLEDKQVFIFDPSNDSKTYRVIAKFLYLLFQHSNWLDSGVKDFKPCKEYIFSEEEKKNGQCLMLELAADSCRSWKKNSTTVDWI